MLPFDQKKFNEAIDKIYSHPPLYVAKKLEMALPQSDATVVMDPVTHALTMWASATDLMQMPGKVVDVCDVVIMETATGNCYFYKNRGGPTGVPAPKRPKVSP